VLTIERQVETRETQAACSAAQRDQSIHHSDVLEVREQQSLRASGGEIIAVQFIERLALLIDRVVERQTVATREQCGLVGRQRLGLREARADAIERLRHLALIRREVRDLAQRRASRRRRDVDRHAVGGSDAEIVSHRQRDRL
jgi:hypothetical protein